MKCLRLVTRTAKLCLGTLLCVVLQGQDRYRIQTYAGQPALTGVVATASYLQSPQGLAIDASNRLLFAQVNGSIISSIDLTTQLIGKVAGNGISGFNGDGQTALQTELSVPRFVAVDAAGNLFICDSNNQRIRRVDHLTGLVTTVAGTGTAGYNSDNIAATSAQLNSPQGIVVDTSGNLYIADATNQRVRRVDASTKIITTIAGTGVAGFNGDSIQATAAQLSNPIGLVLDSAQNVFIADSNNHRIRVINAASQVITTYAGAGGTTYNGESMPAATANVGSVSGLAIDGGGNLLFIDSTNERLRRIGVSSLLVTTIAGNGASGYSGDGGPAASASFSSPAAVVTDASNNIYLADFTANAIRKINSSGVISTFAGSLGPDNVAGISSFLPFPAGNLVDPSGNLYVVDQLDNRVRRFAANSTTVSTAVGTGIIGYSGDNGPATSAQLNFPQGIALDSVGDLFVADTGNFVIRKVAAGTGIITTIAGTSNAGYSGDGGAATSAQLSFPTSVVVDGSNNVYIADMLNHRVRMVSASTGLISTIAGTGTCGYNGDSISATGAQLCMPNGLAFDNLGNLLIADTGNSRVRKITSGVITTLAGTGVSGYSGDGGSALLAQLGKPDNLYVDSNGNIFIADELSVVRMISATTGVITTIAGTGVAGVTGDGGAAKLAQLVFPFGISGDSSGHIYVSDSFGNTVRQLTLQHLLTTAVSPQAGGTVSAGGYFDNGSAVTVTATPNPGYTFTGFSGGITSASNPLGVILNSSITLTANFAATAPLLAPTAVSVTPSSGSGSGQVFTAMYSDASGVNYFNRRLFMINSVLSGSGGCFVQVDPTGTYLVNDSDSALLGPLTGTGVLTNSQCTLNGAGTSVSSSGTTSTLTLSLTFKSSFAGAKSIFMYTDDTAGNNSNWRLLGSYTPTFTTSVPATVSVSPSTGSGSSQVFTAVYSNPAGATILNRRLFLINSALSAVGACFVQADPTGIYLVNDVDSALLGPLTASGTLTNSQCTLNGAGTSIVNSGTTSSLTASLNFKSSFGGARNMYMYTDDSAGNNSNWQLRGSFTVAVGSSVPLAVSVTPAASSGTSQVFTATYSNVAGASVLNRRLFMINSVLSGSGGCFVQADPTGIYLVNDADSALLGPATGSGTLSNSQCTLNQAGTSVSNSGLTSTLTVSLTFNSGFLGAKNIYMYVDDSLGNNSNWQLLGSYSVVSGLSVPTTVSVTPATGSGVNQVLTAVYSDPAGISVLNRRLFLINSTLSGSGGCFVQADPTGIYLVNDADSALFGPLVGGSTLSNSQCTLNGAGTSVLNSGTTSTLTLSLTFKSSFAGTKNIYMYTDDSSGNNSNWTLRGTTTTQ